MVSAVRASRRARCTPTHTWGPWANARWRPAFGRSRSKRSGSVNTAGSRLAAAIDTRTGSPARDRDAAELDVAGRVAVHDRGGGLEPQRFLDCGVEQDRVGADSREFARALEQVRRGVGDHPLGRLDPAEQEHRGVGHDLVGAELGVGGSRRQQRLAIPRADHLDSRSRSCRERLCARSPARRSRRDLGDGADDRVVPRQTAATSPGPSPSARVHREAASGPASARRSSARPPARARRRAVALRRVTTSANRSRTASGLNGVGKRCPVARVRVAVEAEHAGPTTRPVEKRGSSTV